MLTFLIAVFSWVSIVAPGAHIMVDLAPYQAPGAPARTACYTQGEERIFIVLVSARALDGKHSPMELGHIALHEVCHIKLHADTLCSKDRPNGWMSWPEENEAERCVLANVARLGMGTDGRPLNVRGQR